MVSDVAPEFENMVKHRDFDPKRLRRKLMQTLNYLGTTSSQDKALNHKKNQHMVTNCWLEWVNTFIKETFLFNVFSLTVRVSLVQVILLGQGGYALLRKRKA